MDLSECEMRGNNKHSLCRLSSTLGQIAGLSLMLIFIKFQITCLQSEQQLRSSVDNLRLDSALDEKFSELLLLCDTETEPHREEVHVTMEAEIRVMKIYAEQRLGLLVKPAARERHGIGSPAKLPGKAEGGTLISDL